VGCPVGFKVGLGSEGADVVFTEGATVVAFDGAGGGVDALCPLRSQIHKKRMAVVQDELPLEFAIYALIYGANSKKFLLDQYSSRSSSESA